MTVDESHNVRVLEALEDVDLQREVFFELLIEFRQVDRLDGDVGAVFLSITQKAQVSKCRFLPHHRASLWTRGSQRWGLRGQKDKKRKHTECTPW
jgi:hypothetical protein